METNENANPQPTTAEKKPRKYICGLPNPSQIKEFRIKQMEALKRKILSSQKIGHEHKASLHILASTIEKFFSVVANATQNLRIACNLLEKIKDSLDLNVALSINVIAGDVIEGECRINLLEDILNDDAAINFMQERAEDDTFPDDTYPIEFLANSLKAYLPCFLLASKEYQKVLEELETKAKPN